MRPYVIKFEQLGLGKHEFSFTANGSIFEGSDFVEIKDAEFEILLSLYKTSNTMDLSFNYSGSIDSPCDRCDEIVKTKLEGESKLIIKYGQSHHEDLDELIVLGESEYEIDLYQHIYESLWLLIPARLVHDEADCDQEILSRIVSKSKEKGGGKTDPRWEKLKEI